MSYAEFRELQLEHIRANLARRAQEEGREEVEELDSDAASEAAEEVDDDEYREHEERRPVTQLLQLVKPVETRWNSTMYMVQRSVAMCDHQYNCLLVDMCISPGVHGIELCCIHALGHFVCGSLLRLG